MNIVLTFAPYPFPQLVGELDLFLVGLEEVNVNAGCCQTWQQLTFHVTTYSKPPRMPLSIGATKDLYDSLFFSAGGFIYDFPSVAFSLQGISTDLNQKNHGDRQVTQKECRGKTYFGSGSRPS
jgi:hypothetical protein